MNVWIRIVLLLAMAAVSRAQVIHTTAALDTDNVFTGANRFTKSITLTEAVCLNGLAGAVILCDDPTSHRLKFNPNNIGQLYVVGISNPATGGNCSQFAANGIDLVDSGAACGGGGGGGVSGSGTANRVPMWSAGTVLTNSAIAQYNSPPIWDAPGGYIQLQADAGLGASVGGVLNLQSVNGPFTAASASLLVGSSGIQINANGLTIFTAGGLKSIITGPGTVQFGDVAGTKGRIDFVGNTSGTQSILCLDANCSSLQTTVLNLANVTGSTQCLHASSTGVVTGTGTDCVASVFGRTGAVVAVSGDYTAALVTNAVSTIATNTGNSAMTLNMAASTSAAAFRLPNLAAASSTIAGAVSYDTTNKNIHAGANAVDNFVGLLPSSITPANNDCVKFTVVSNVITLNTAGSACGVGGAVSSVFGRTGAVVAVSGDYTAALVTNAVSTAASNIGAAAMTLDMSASTSTSGFRVPNIAGASSTIAGAISYDTTNKNYHAGANGVDNRVIVLPTSITPANNDCVKFTVSAGTITLNTAGAACGTGGGAVTSVFGRTGAVTAASGDYLVAQITGAAPLASPTFTGSPTAPTPVTGSNSTLLATTAFVKNQGYISGTGTVTFIPVFTSPSAVGNSLLSDDGTTLTYTGTGGAVFTSSAAGFIGLGQGTAQSTSTNTIGLTAPVSVTAYNLLFPSAAGNGYMKWSNAANIVTGSFRTVIDTVGANVDLTSQSGSLGAQNLVASVPTTGRYQINYYLSEAAGCATPGPGVVTATFSWTDATVARTLVSATLAFTTSPGAGDTIRGTIPLWAVSASAITVITTYTACTTGTATYDIHAWVTEAQ